MRVASFNGNKFQNVFICFGIFDLFTIGISFPSLFEKIKNL